MKKWFVLLLTLLFILSGCSKSDQGQVNSESASEAKSEPISIKISTVQLPNQQMGKGIQKLRDGFVEKLGDKVDIKLYDSAQLYTGAEEMEALKRGDVQMAFTIGGASETLSTKMQVVKLPFLFPSEDAAYKVLEGKTGAELSKIFESNNLELLAIVSSGHATIANSKRPLKMPQDFKGLKLRAPGKMDSLSMNSLGAIAMVTPSEETYTAIQQGVIDGMTTPSSVFLLRKYNEVQKYATDGGNMSFQCAFFIANKGFWDGLDPEIRQVMSEVIDNVEAEMREEMKAENDVLFKQMEEKGVEVHHLTPEEEAAWKEATQPVYKEMANEIGQDLIELAQSEAEEVQKTLNVK